MDRSGLAREIRTTDTNFPLKALAPNPREVAEVRRLAVQHAVTIRRLDAEIEQWEGSVQAASEALVRAIFKRAKYIASKRPAKHGLVTEWKSALSRELGYHGIESIQKALYRAKATDEQVEQCVKCCRSQNDVDRFLRLSDGAHTTKKDVEKPPLVLAAVIGDNSDLIAGCCKLYAPKGSRIADVTFGQGAFWSKVDLSQYEFFASDISPHSKRRRKVQQGDCRKLTYESGSLDVVVIDPPYDPYPHRGLWFEQKYQNVKTVHGMTMGDIRGLYADGMREAYRVLRSKGTCWVKGQDFVHAGRQQWNQRWIEIAAEEIGYDLADVFLLVTPNPPPMAGLSRQRRARHNYSFLLVLEKRS